MFVTFSRQLDKLTKSGPSAALFSTSPHSVTPGQPTNDENSEAAESTGTKAVSTAAHSLAALATDRQMSSESAGSATEAAAAASGQHPLAQTHQPLALQRLDLELGSKRKRSRIDQKRSSKN